MPVGEGPLVLKVLPNLTLVKPCIPLLAALIRQPVLLLADQPVQACDLFPCFVALGFQLLKRDGLCFKHGGLCWVQG